MSACPRIGCTALLREDRQFRSDMEAYDLPQRRFWCDMGHSFTTGVPSLPTAPRVVTARRPPGLLHARVCVLCHEPFEGKALQKYCSLDCSHEIDRERTRRRNEARRAQMSPAELTRLRAIPFGHYGPSKAAPMPYADRPAGLDHSWV